MRAKALAARLLARFFPLLFAESPMLLKLLQCSFAASFSRAISLLASLRGLEQLIRSSSDLSYLRLVGRLSLVTLLVSSRLSQDALLSA